MVTKTTLIEELKKHFGFDTFKGNQESIMTSLLEGKDTFVLMPTGEANLCVINYRHYLWKVLQLSFPH